MAITKYDLDINKQAIIKPVVILRQGDHDIDTMQVSLSVANEPMDLTGATVKFMGNTANGRKIIDDAHVKIIDAKGGVFEYVFPSEAASDIGEYKVAYFSIILANGQSSTMDFRVQVLSGVDLSAPAASDYVSHYDTMVSTLNSVYDSATSATNTKMAAAVSSVASSAATVLDSALARVATVNSQASNASSTANNAVSMASSVASAVTSQASYINSVASSAAADVNRALDKLNNISVGGRNYILNSSSLDATNSNMPVLIGATADNRASVAFSDTGIKVSNNQGNSEWYYGLASAWTDITKTPLIAGTTYTISLKAVGSIPQVALRVGFRGSARVDERSNFTNITNDKWSKATFTFTLPSDTTSIFIRIHGANNNSYATGFTGNEYFTMKELMLEQSNVASDWTPAPEDKPMGLSVGGRNLLLDTARSFTGIGTNTTNGNFNTQNGVYYLAGSKKVSDLYNQYGSSGYLTLSFDWAATGSTISGQFNPQWNSFPWNAGIITNIVKISATNTSGHYKATVPLKTDGYSNGWATGIMFRQDNLQGNITISNMKLEAGNIATDWTPAPEDADNTFLKKSNKLPDEAHDFAVIASDTNKYQGTWYTDGTAVANGPTDNWNWNSIEVIGGFGNGAGIIRTAGFGYNQEYITTVNSGKIVGWKAVANDANVVHKTDNETVAGDKTFTGNVTIPKNKVTVNTAYGTFTLTKTLDIVHIQSHISKDIPDNINVPNVVPQGFRPDGVSVPMTFIHGLDKGVIAVNPDGSLYTSSNIVPNTSFLAASWSVAGN